MLLLPDTVTLKQASDTLRMLSQALQREGGSALTVDASPLREFDSAALAVLLECHRLATASGKTFAVTGAPAKLLKLAKLYGVEQLVALAPLVPGAGTEAPGSVSPGSVERVGS